MLQISEVLLVKLTIRETPDKCLLWRQLAPVAVVGVVVERLKIVEGSRVVVQQLWLHSRYIHIQPFKTTWIEKHQEKLECI